MRTKAQKGLQGAANSVSRKARTKNGVRFRVGVEKRCRICAIDCWKREKEKGGVLDWVFFINGSVELGERRGDL